MESNSKKDELKKFFGIAYWPIYCALFPLATVATFNIRHPLKAALIWILVSINLVLRIIQ